MMNCALRMMNCVLKTRNFVFKLMNSADADGSGALSRSEVAQLAESLNAKLTERDLDASMAEMDEDGDGGANERTMFLKN